MMTDLEGISAQNGCQIFMSVFVKYFSRATFKYNVDYSYGNQVLTFLFIYTLNLN